MQHYHCAVAVGHFARALAANYKGRGGGYQTIAALSALWMRAPDPFAPSAIVFVAVEHLAGIVPSDGRMRQLVSELRDIKALETPDGGGYRLLKPAFADLDDVARAELARAAELAERANTLVRDARAATETTRPMTGRNAAEALMAGGKQLSDVAEKLAWLAGVPKSKIKYSGKGSVHVRLAAEFAAAYGWSEFDRVCKAVRADQSPDKPADLRWLFARRNAAYLARFMPSGDTPKPEPEASGSADSTAPENKRTHDPAVLKAARGLLMYCFAHNAPQDDELAAFADMTAEHGITDDEWQKISDRLFNTKPASVRAVGLCLTPAGRQWVVDNLQAIRGATL
jgi:ribosomal protein L17